MERIFGSIDAAADYIDSVTANYTGPAALDGKRRNLCSVEGCRTPHGEVIYLIDAKTTLLPYSGFAKTTSPPTSDKTTSPPAFNPVLQHSPLSQCSRQRSSMLRMVDFDV
jgi:hypothetical protein